MQSVGCYGPCQPTALGEHMLLVYGAGASVCISGTSIDYRAWVRDQALSQSMYLIAVEGRRPA